MCLINLSSLNPTETELSCLIPRYTCFLKPYRVREDVHRIIDVFCIKVISPSQHHSFLHPKPVFLLPSLHTVGAHHLSMVVLLPLQWSPSALHISSAYFSLTFPLSPIAENPGFTLHTPKCPSLHLPYPSLPCLPSFPSSLPSLPLTATALHNSTQVQTVTQAFHQALIFSSFLLPPAFTTSGQMIALATLSPICTVSLHFPFQLLLCF